MVKRSENAKPKNHRVTIEDLLRDEQAPGALVLLLTLPNIILIPSVPVLPFLCGLPAILILWGMMRRNKTSMPKWCMHWGISSQAAERCIKFGVRLSFLAKQGRKQEWLEGVLVLPVCLMGIILTFLMCLPLPLANLPVAFSCLFLAMGLARKDGLLAWMAAIAGIPSIAFMVWAFYNLAGVVENAVAVMGGTQG